MKRNFFFTALILLLGFQQSVFSQDEIQEFETADYSQPAVEDEVLYEKKQDITVSYKERRERYGILFSLNYEKLFPKEFVSPIQGTSFVREQGVSNEEILSNEAINMTGVELGLKINFVLGSVTGLVGYSTGNYSNSSTKVESINVGINKFAINYALDSLMSEPWFVPYAQVGIHQLSWNETSSLASGDKSQVDFSTDVNYHHKLGVLLQLNWIEKAIDPTTHYQGLRSSGLENTFLDIYYTTYLTPNNTIVINNIEQEAKLDSSEFGAALKLEF